MSPSGASPALRYNAGMSSILDALNRSDAERRRGQPPTLGSPAPFAATPRRRPAWLLPAIAGAALAAAWWGGAFDFGGDPADPPAAPVPASVAAPDGHAPAPPGAAGADAGAMPDPVPAPGAAPDPVAATPAEPAPAPTSPADGQVVTIFGPQRAAPVPAEAAPATPDSGEAAPAPAAAPPMVPAPGAAEAEAAAAQALAQALERPTPPVAPAATATGDAPPRLHELPFAVRRGLPALAVTMHLYSDDPARRFALVNGVRVRDGESLPGGVEVLAIRADGILVRFEGTEFVLPVRG